MDEPIQKFKEAKDDLISILRQTTNLLVDSKDVADVFQIQHETLFKLLKKHQDDLTSLGNINFQTEKDSTNTKHKKYAYINFEQVNFLLNLMKTIQNTKKDFHSDLKLSTFNKNLKQAVQYDPKYPSAQP